ncbi:hypothetical protein [Duganella radicis]|uniref:Uncharacterized protein n=1 Tax=Duganella radicis TaxID=551988 RepID=A0A6L6PK00_9BURK|nr:hypothetical protein [Duganella radicis]MTV39314.1 hypothetical protein [Duganella radicis]
MKKLSVSFLFGSGTFVGTIIYTGYLTPPYLVNWGHALFVGLFAGIAAAIVHRVSGG